MPNEGNSGNFSKILHKTLCCDPSFELCQNHLTRMVLTGVTVYALFEQ